MIRRDDGRGPRHREQLVLRADEDAHALGAFGAAEQIDHVAPRFQVVEQVPHPLQVLDHLEVAEQMRLAAHDELALLAARPAREPVVDHLLRQLVELGLRRGPRLLQLDPRLGQRLAADARVEEVSGLDQRRGRQSDRQIDDAVLDLAVLADQHDQRPFGLEPHEFDVLQPHVRLRGQHHAGRVGQSGQQARGLGQHVLDRLAGAGDLGLDLAPLALVEVADLHQRIDEEAQAQLRRQPPGRGVRRIDQAELLEVRHDVAHRSGRQRRGDQPRQIARAERLAGGQIALDDLAENLARALVELRQADLRPADGNVLRHAKPSPPAPELSIRRQDFKPGPCPACPHPGRC